MNFHPFSKQAMFFLFVVILIELGGCKKAQPKPLDILVPPSMNSLVCDLGLMFEQNYGIPVNVKSVDLSLVDCQTLDDILFCNDSQKEKDLYENGCVAGRLPISYTFPVIVIPKDNPHKITEPKELLSSEFNIVMQEPSECLRRLTCHYFPECGTWHEIDAETSLVEELAKPNCDAVLTWKFIADTYSDDQVTVFPLSDNPDHTVNIDVLVLTHCKDVNAYHAFLKTLTSHSGREILKKHNLSVIIR